MSIACRCDKACKSGIHLDFETQGRRHQNPKQGYQWPHKKDLFPTMTGKRFCIKKRYISMSLTQSGSKVTAKQIYLQFSMQS